LCFSDVQLFSDTLWQHATAQVRLGFVNIALLSLFCCQYPYTAYFSVEVIDGWELVDDILNMLPSLRAQSEMKY